MKHIHFDKRHGTYVLNKKIYGKTYNFGTYDTLDLARIARDYFEKEGWVDNLENRLMFTKTKNIEKHGNKWVIAKQIDGCKHTFGRFNTYAEAVAERDLLKRNQWSWDLICEEDEREDDKTIFLNKLIY